MVHNSVKAAVPGGVNSRRNPEITGAVSLVGTPLSRATLPGYVVAAGQNNGAWLAKMPRSQPGPRRNSAGYHP